MNNDFILEYHIIQSFPSTCLNRDDIGSPKECLIGGAKRARVSSQCWKREVRAALQDFGAKVGMRTKNLHSIFEKSCLAAGATSDQAQACGAKIADELSKDTVFFISQSEADEFAKNLANVNFDLDKVKEKDLAKWSKKSFNPAADALDIALFGRMVAKSPTMNVEAASAFSHAISTHEVETEIDFFTAVDDQASEDNAGSGHMGTNEFNSATYYRYVSLDVSQLAKGLSPEDLKKAIATFTKALYVAVPQARQSTFSGFGAWDFARVLVRKGPRLQASFDAPVRSRNGFSQLSIKKLKDYLDQKEKQHGSLFGKLGSYEVGDEGLNIDDLISSIISHVQE